MRAGSACPFLPSKAVSTGSSCCQPLDQREQRGPRDAEAIVRLAALARPAAEGRGLLWVVQEPLDRASERWYVARLDYETAAVEDLRDHRDRGRDDRARESHRIEELRRHLSHGVRRLSLGHGDDVGSHEVARHVVERDLRGDLDMRKSGPAGGAATGRIDADERQQDPRAQRAYGVDQVVDTLVPARRSEKHHDLPGTEILAGTRRRAIVE